MGQPHSIPNTDELRYWLALMRAPGIGSMHFQRLLDCCGTPRALFESPANAACGNPALPPRTRAYFKQPHWKQVDTDLHWAKADDCHILVLHDPRYPTLLREIPDPPPLLFVRGDPAALTNPQLAIVGSRNPSAGGRQSAQDFAHLLTLAGLTITSGLALGIDAQAHLGALEAGESTLAVAGTGLDRVYPARHRDLARRIVEHGAIISEFPLGTPPVAGNFPRRNRIISGLSLGTLVIEAALRSGSLITARLAAEQGREVFAIPGSIHNPLARGCHALIRQGAKLTETITDILEELGPLAAISHDVPAAPEPQPAAPPSHSLIDNMGYEPISIDTLVARSGLTPEAVSSMLLTLELQGRVTSIGGLYSRRD